MHMAKPSRCRMHCCRLHNVVSAFYFREMRFVPQSILLPGLLACATAHAVETESGSNSGWLAQVPPRPFVTNAAQFRALSGSDWLVGCNFKLTGVVTLVDTNRDLAVVEDRTGAVALHMCIRDWPLRIGQLVSVEGTNAVQYVPSFPSFPHRPSSNAILKRFEAPADLGEYYLTRMRGYLCPPETGEYTFWIASDNSSELWLSTDNDPRNKRKIASLARYSWVNPREWSRYPSQRSEPVFLKAGERYYIEAIHEQATLAGHLAIAWAGPSLPQSIIDHRHLTPWVENASQAGCDGTTGILWEYWTNFTAGNLEIVTWPRPFEAALSVETAEVKILGSAQLPEPKKLSLGKSLGLEDNYRWVEVEGYVTFVGLDESLAFLEISVGQGKALVRVPNATKELIRAIRDRAVRVNGVCEGVYDQNRILVPGIIWSPGEESISLVEIEEALPLQRAEGHLGAAPGAAARTLSGFYSTRGVITFNDCVFGTHYLFIQEDTGVVRVLLEGLGLKNDFKVGQWLDAAGTLERDRYVPVLRPLVLSEVGWHLLPAPITQPVQFLAPEDTDCRWAEVDGVVRRVNANGTLWLMSKSGHVNLWLSRTDSNHLSRYVDARVRARGVLSLTIQDSPLLLIPGQSFIHVEQEPPKDPFQIHTSCVSNLWVSIPQPELQHRIKLVGTVTYKDTRSFFLQDDSGGVRVFHNADQNINVGEQVEVVGFPNASGPTAVLTECLVRSRRIIQPVKPRKLNFGEVLSFRQNGLLIETTANLLSQKTTDFDQILQLQEHGYVFEAVLAPERGRVPSFARGSRLKVVGICDYGTSPQSGDSKPGIQSAAAGLIRVLMRAPSDAVVLSGPPWWTFERTVTVVGVLLATLFVALVWVYLLRRRLERHQAARLAFARQFLQGQETERQRIAVNLHDSLGQYLLVIKNKVRLAMQAASDEPALRQRLNEISEAASQAVEEVRQIINNLRPYQLGRLGLTQAIRAIVNRATENSSILFASHVDDIDSFFDKDAEIHIYRIVQEAVNNILKHSQATEATVVVKMNSDCVSISIRDNGKGFELGTLDFASAAGPGHGLSSIAERVRILGGKWELDSAPAQGTRLTIEIPKPVVRQ